MKRQELDKLIQGGQPPHAVMLYGDSHFLIERYVRLLSAKEDANILSLYHGEYNFNSAKAHLSQGSLFGGQNVLIIKNEKKVPKKELDALLELCKKSPDNIFIYAYYGPDFKKPATAAFTAKSGGVAIRLFAPFLGEAKAILMQEAASMGIQLDQHAAYHLLEVHNNDLGLACNELTKFQIFDKPIGAKEIDNLVFGMGEVKIDQLIHKILKKEDYFDDLQRVLESGEDEIRILTAVSGFVTQLYLFYAYIKLHGAANSIDILGFKLPPAVEKDRTQLCIRFKQQSYTSMLNLLMDSELKMKSSGAVDKNAILLSSLMKLQRIM
ncbi:MAG: DNA polymerase III subunit delta [Campylobacterota bacterium]|nr:DNA polymerase III subunit delta [Campylobacterota bacterium]